MLTTDRSLFKPGDEMRLPLIQIDTGLRQTRIVPRTAYDFGSGQHSFVNSDAADDAETAGSRFASTLALATSHLSS
jgi:hypothetical protein